jgi:hypothetical protein
MADRLALAQAAVRTGQKARVALIGPSGAGKTWTALTVAGEFGKKILLIDTEEGSGALYADKFAYDHLNWLPPYDPRDLTSTLETAGQNYDVVIVDSLSHFWDDEGGLLDIVDSVAARSSSKNSFAAWKEGTPIQKDMVRSFLRCGAHVIVTMRAKTEYVLEQDERGKTAPKRVGLAPVQRAGLEYEFTVIGLLELNHQLIIDKSRCDLVADKRYLKGKSAEFGKALAGWLAGAAPTPTLLNGHSNGVGAAPASTPQATPNSGAQPSAPADPEREPLYELARTLPQTPQTRPMVDDLIDKKGLAVIQTRLINGHKLQCGSNCEHLTGVTQ